MTYYFHCVVLMLTIDASAPAAHWERVSLASSGDVYLGARARTRLTGQVDLLCRHSAISPKIK